MDWDSSLAIEFFQIIIKDNEIPISQQKDFAVRQNKTIDEFIGIIKLRRLLFTNRYDIRFLLLFRLVW